MKSKYLVASVMLMVVLSLAVYSTLHSISEITIISVDESETSSGGFGNTIGVMLNIELERDGEIIHTMYKDDDLVLRSAAGIMHYLIKGTDVEPSLAYRLTNGASYTLQINSISDYIGSNGADMHIGTGTTAPTYNDYKLETEVYLDGTEALGYSVAGLQMNSTFVTTFTILGTYAITEAGFSVYTLNGGVNDAMLFRDVFSAINVISGDILTVKYILMFN